MKTYDYFFDFGDPSENIFQVRYAIKKDVRSPPSFYLYRASQVIQIDSNNKHKMIKNRYSSVFDNSFRELTDEEKEEFFVKLLSAVII